MASKMLTPLSNVDKALGENALDDARLFDPGQALVEALERKG